MFGQYFGNNWTILEKSSYNIFVQCIDIALDNIWIISGSGWDIHWEPGNQVPTKSSDSHDIFCSISRCFGTNLTSRSVFPVK